MTSTSPISMDSTAGGCASMSMMATMSTLIFVLISSSRIVSSSLAVMLALQPFGFSRTAFLISSLAYRSQAVIR